jgi:hypothetical protein
VRCFWDAQDIQDGSDWKKTFQNALEHCCLFVPIVSEAALAPMKKIKATDLKSDNVLLEYEMANALAAEKRLNIFPVLVGGGDRGTATGVTKKALLQPRKKNAAGDLERFDFAEFGPHMFPQHPSSTHPKGTISATINAILAYQGVKLQSDEDLKIFTGPAANTSTTTDVTAQGKFKLAPRVVQVNYSLTHMYPTLFFFFFF